MMMAMEQAPRAEPVGPPDPKHLPGQVNCPGIKDLRSAQALGGAGAEPCQAGPRSTPWPIKKEHPLRGCSGFAPTQERAAVMMAME